MDIKEGYTDTARDSNFLLVIELENWNIYRMTYIQ